MVKYSLTLQNRETCFVRKHSPILSSKHGHIYRPQTKLRESSVLQAYVCPLGGRGGGGVTANASWDSSHGMVPPGHETWGPTPC